MTLNEILSRLHEAKKTANGWEAHCPAHEDKNASLSITEGQDGRILLHCHAGCTIEQIVSALGLKLPDLFPVRKAPAPGTARIDKTYDYPDATGNLLFQVVRFDPKGFRQRRPDGNGGWIWKMTGVQRVLYRLPAVIEAVKAGQVIFLVEGEKDADALVSIGLCGTCNPGGAGKWLPQYTETLTGAHVVIIADRDDPGRKHAALVAAELHGKATSLKALELPDHGDQKIKDAADWLAAGGTAEELKAIVEAAPVWSPPATPTNEYGPALIIERNKQTINQAHFAARYVSDSGIVHDPAVSRFYVYDPATGLWRHQTDEVTVCQIGLCFQVIVSEEGYPDLISKRSSSILHGLCELARGIAERRDAFNQRRDVIHVSNGMLALDDAGHIELKPFAPEFYSRNRSEIAWNPDADCPRFKRDLLLSAMPEEDANLIQRYAGQCLLGMNLSQTFLILRGTPGGGKTTLANVIEGVIGRHNVTELRISQLCERFELIRYVGRTLLSGKDVPGDFLNMRPAHVLKALVGGDTLEGEVKHGNESFSIEGRYNVLISTNTRLRVKLDTDAGAWRRRMLIVDYAKPKPAKPIPNFDSILLREEGEGILRWAVDGAIQLKQEMDSFGALQLTESQRRRVDDLLSESDSVRSFVRECVVYSQGSEIAIHDLMSAYRDFCELREWEPVRDRQFQSELPDAMLEFHRAIRRNDIRQDGKSVRGYRGVKLQTCSGQPSEASATVAELPFSDGTDAHPEIIPRESSKKSQDDKSIQYAISSAQSSEASEPKEVSIEDEERVAIMEEGSLK
jgi:P4 family phage/plasmid primase-like protien